MVIHRDLKPSNFLITHNGFVMLADFGLAKELSEPDMLLSTGSQPTVVGTLAYISPEQFKEGICGTYVDFWALGLILYEMLCGYSAFNVGDTDEFV